MIAATKFELRTLSEYSDEALLSELRRVADTVNGKRLTLPYFNAVARVHSTTLRNRFGSWQAALDLAGISERTAPRYRVLSRPEVIAAIREHAHEHPGEPITQEAVAIRMGVDPGSITRRFGKWGPLLAELGLEPVPLGRRYSDEECYENVLALWTHYGRQPHFAELKQPPSTVGPKAYVRRWGGWRAALAAFVSHVNHRLDQEHAESVVETGPQSSHQLGSSVPATTSMPRSISLALRYTVLSRDRFRCLACGASPAKDLDIVLHVDHVIPWSRGGKNDADNLRTLCQNCNLGKGARMENQG